MSRSAAVLKPIQKRVAALLKESYPGRPGRPLKQPGRPPAVSALPGKETDLSDYIRQLRNGRGYPDPAKAWEVGHALAGQTRKKWLNPVVALFAYGHYADVAELFVRIRTHSAGDPLAEMARTLPGVVRPKAELSFALTDDLAAAEARHWDREMGPAEPYERRVWDIGGGWFGRFSQAWRARGTRLPSLPGANALVNGCALIANHADYEVEDRDEQVALLISDWVMPRSQRDKRIRRLGPP
jgi:hypothetical protein